MQKQVDVTHYNFGKYVPKTRWIAFYHQIDEIISIKPSSILEVGVGSGVLKMMMKYFLFYGYESMDIDGALNPDHVGSILEMPFPDSQYDVIGCFQVLEHLPYENFEKALSELFRVARKAVVLSLPDAGRIIELHIPKICKNKFIKWPFGRLKEHKFDGQHYWELNKKGYGTKRVIQKMREICKKYDYAMEKEYRIWECKFFHFFVFKKTHENTIL